MDRLSGNPQELRKLLLLAGDVEAVATMDRNAMGQSPTVEVTEMGTRHGN